MTVIDLRAMGMKPRDDARSLTGRIVLERKEVAARGLSFTFVTEQISDPTYWCSFDNDHHLVYVYLGGAVHSMRTSPDWGGQPGRSRRRRGTSDGSPQVSVLRLWSKAMSHVTARSPSR